MTPTALSPQVDALPAALPDALAKKAAYYQEARPELQALINAAGARILDIGCAAGELGAALKRAGAVEVVGVELSEDAAAQARTKLDQVFHGNVEQLELPLEAAHFDYIIFADLLEHTVDPWQVLTTYSHFLKPGGHVIASLPNVRFHSVITRLLFNRWEYSDRGILDSTHLRFFTLPTIREMFARTGFDVEQVQHKYRLIEDQRRIGRAGALISRLFCRFLAPLPWRHFFTHQYIIVARKAA